MATRRLPSVMQAGACWAQVGVTSPAITKVCTKPFAVAMTRAEQVSPYLHVHVLAAVTQLHHQCLAGVNVPERVCDSLLVLTPVLCHTWLLREQRLAQVQINQSTCCATA